MASLTGVRQAELIAMLSLAVDLGLGQPPGHVARATIAAGRLADRMALGVQDRTTLFHVALLGWVGCIADSRDAATWFGDDIEYRAGVYDVDLAPLPFLGYLLGRAGSGDPPVTKALKRAGIALDHGRSVRESLQAHCQVTTQVAQRLGLSDQVCSSLQQVFARWDGKGLPNTLRGADLSLPIRLWQLTDVAEVHYRRGGADAVTRVVGARRGSQFDPALVDLMCTDIDGLFADLHPDTTWDDVISAEPTWGPELSEEELDHVLETMADWVDLKSPWFTGHSRAVADLAATASTHLGLPPDQVTLVRRAGLVHELGRVGVPNTIWDKPGELTGRERERLRLASYYTERMLSRPRLLAEIGAVAARAHERLDGSGYHTGVGAAALSMPARVLAVAESFRTKLEARPHRPARSPQEASDHLRSEARAERLDPIAVEAVLATSGHGERPVRSPGPAGLTPREMQVLVHIARGLTNREVARTLGISAKTVGNHVERIYAKAGVSTRAAATLFAMEHRLIPPAGAPTER